MHKNMTPAQIKAALKRRDISQSGLARDLGCTPQHIFLVIKDPTRSFPAAQHIATALGKNRLMFGLSFTIRTRHHPNQGDLCQRVILIIKRLSLFLC